MYRILAHFGSNQPLYVSVIIMHAISLTAMHAQLFLIPPPNIIILL